MAARIALVCCLLTDTPYGSHVSAAIRPAGPCAMPRTGRACESSLAHVADACDVTVCAPTPPKLADPERCGNGRIDPGEDCDPPDDRLCSSSCRSCPQALGRIALGCTDVATGTPDAFLVGFSASTKRGSRPVVTRRSDGTRFVVAWREVRASGSIVRIARVATDGSLVDARPIGAVAIDGGPFDVVASPSAILVAVTSSSSARPTAVRGVVLPNGPRAAAAVADREQR